MGVILCLAVMGEQLAIDPHDWDSWCRRLAGGWLVDIPASEIVDRAAVYSTELKRQQVNYVLLSAAEPIDFIARVMAASCLELPLFLTDDRWGESEKLQVSEILKLVDRSRDRQKIIIPTGGSSGKLKFAVHTWQTLSASAMGFREFYEIDLINSVCILPLFHVSGWMQLVRSFLTAGRLLIADYHRVLSTTESIDKSEFFISLVPTQLRKLIELDPDWLGGFKTVLLGGAPAPIDLLDRARALNIPLALTYGMTETASQICSLKPTEFLAGNITCGRVLPHAQITILTGDRAGEIAIESKSLMLGYYPNFTPPIECFYPDDLGTFDRDGYLTISGRTSDKIITGGEKVFASEIIQAIIATELVKDAWAIGIPDSYWGQAIAAIYVPISPEITSESILAKIGNNLSRYKLPKHWIATTEIPRNALGKILLDRLALLVANKFKTP
jgi:o-succinylbenzoate---CoA ligase